MLNYLEDETIIEIVFWKKDVVHFHLDLATWAAWPLTDTLTLARNVSQVVLQKVQTTVT